MLAFDLSEEQRSIRQTVRRFVERELMPLEPRLLRREVDGGGPSPGLMPDERRQLEEQGKALGFWGIDTPSAYGGADLDPLTQAIIHEELGRSFVEQSRSAAVMKGDRFSAEPFNPAHDLGRCISVAMIRDDDVEAASCFAPLWKSVKQNAALNGCGLGLAWR